MQKQTTWNLLAGTKQLTINNIWRPPFLLCCGVTVWKAESTHDIHVTTQVTKACWNESAILNISALSSISKLPTAQWEKLYFQWVGRTFKKKVCLVAKGVLNIGFGMQCNCNSKIGLPDLVYRPCFITFWPSSITLASRPGVVIGCLAGWCFGFAWTLELIDIYLFLWNLVSLQYLSTTTYRVTKISWVYLLSVINLKVEFIFVCNKVTLVTKQKY